LLCGSPAFVKPAAHRLDGIFASARLGVPLELVDGIEQRLSVARGGKALADAGDTRGEIVENGLGHPWAREQKRSRERSLLKHLRAL